MVETNPGELNSKRVSEPGGGFSLSSWKEIAHYLKIDVRTCQRWEQSFGLPVHRIQNSLRSRVVAYPAEIEAWREKAVHVKDRTANGDPVNNGNGAGPATNGLKNSNGHHQAAASRQRFKPKYFAFLAIPIITAAAALALFPLDRNPADFHIKGSSLIVLNKSGRKLWVFETKLAKHRDESFYRRRFPDKNYVADKEGVMAQFSYVYFRDLDGDGRNEVLFAPQTKDDLQVGKLYLFDGRGNLKWIFDSGTEIHVGDRRYPPDFVINILDLREVNGDGRPEILVGSHCYEEAPERFVILDMEKRILGEYWSYGQLSDYVTADNNGDGRPEVILVGTNNEYGQAFIVVLDPADMKGTSPQSSSFKFAGMSEGTARYYVRCPITEVDRLKYPRGVFISVRAMKNEHVVAETAENLVWYDFDKEMNPPQITLTDSLSAAYREALQKKLIPPPFDREALKKELAAGVLYYDGQTKAWVNHRAMANPWPEKK